MEHIVLIEVVDLEPRRPARLQLRTCFLERLNRFLECGLRLWRHRAVRVVEDISHSETGQNAVPPDDPPGERVRSQGLFVVP